MANKKILYTDTTGIIKELPIGSGVTASYYEDSGNGALFAKSISFNSMSFKDDGLLVVNNGAASVLKWPNGDSVRNYDVISWDGFNSKWKYIVGNIIDITGSIPGMGPTDYYTASANADITGSFREPKIKSLSNVITGTLSVVNGGTGLAKSDFSDKNLEYMFLGNSNSKFQFLTASNSSLPVTITSNGTSWEYVTQSINNTVEVSVFTASGIWTRPEGTKAVRVIVQGGGGGGGAGGNFNSITSSIKGGAGGAAGGIVDKYLGHFTYDTASITVGKGGSGGSIENIGIFNGSGSDGASSSFGTFLSASGGRGGLNGNLITSSGGFNTSINTLPIYLDVYNFKNINYNGLSGMSGADLSGSDSLYTKNIYSAGGASGGGSLGNYSTDATNGLVSSDDVVFQLRFNSDGSATNLINNGIVVSSYTNQTLKYASSTWNPFVDKYDNEYSVYNPSPSTELAYYGISSGSQAIEGDFTFEVNASFYDISTPIYTTLINFRLYGGPPTVNDFSYLSLVIENDGSIRLVSNDGTVPSHYTAAGVISLNTNYHIAFVRKNGYYSVFVNGKKINWSVGGTWKNLKTLYVYRLFGIHLSSANDGLYGYVTNPRLTKKALYVSTFNPPESRYEVDSRKNIGQNALSSSVTSLNLLNLQEQNFSNNSHIKNIFKGTGGGGGASVIFPGDFYFIADNVSSSAVFVLDGIPDYDGLPDYTAQQTREMISNIPINFQNSCAVTRTSPARPSGSFIFSDSGLAINGMNFSQNRNIGTGDFTIESWVRISNTTKNHMLFDFRAGGYTYGGIYILIASTSARLQFAWNSGGPAAYLSTAAIPVNTWTHIAIVRQNGVTSFYINGAFDGSSSNFTAAVDNNTTQTSYIGYAGYATNTSRVLVGYMDRIRIYKSAIYTSNFTPSTSLYKDYTAITSSYLGGIGGDGVYGSGGGGGGSNLNVTGSNVGLRQGGNGGDGYVAVISYKY